MVLIQKWPCFQLFFFACIGQENVFYDILERKHALLGYKNKKFKKSKHRQFLKGVNPWFWSKNGHFSNFFFQAIQARKMFSMISQNKKTLFQAIKRRGSKSRHIDNFPKGLTHGFDPKTAIFLTFFFYPIQDRKMCFMIFQKEKTPFQSIKTRSSKSRKIPIFPKGLTHCFGPKNGNFSNFFFQAILTRKMSFMIFQSEKRAFQAIKTKSSKSQKNETFPKGLTLGFDPKMAIFPTFFFRPYRPGKCLL